MKPLLKYVELYHGCAIRTGRDSAIWMQYGTDNVKRIRPATSEDVAWVRAMGGDVPDGRLIESASAAVDQTVRST